MSLNNITKATLAQAFLKPHLFLKVVFFIVIFMSTSMYKTVIVCAFRVLML